MPLGDTMGANASPYLSARTVGHQEPIRRTRTAIDPDEAHQGPTTGTSWAQRRRKKAKKPFPLLPVMQEVPGQPSRKCGPLPHLISDHQAGWTQQAVSVLQMLCETGPTGPPCVCALCHGLAAAGESPGCSCHTHTELVNLLCWSLVDTGGMLSWVYSCQKRLWLQSLTTTADSSLSRPLSILSPPQRPVHGLQISIFPLFLDPTPLCGIYKESLNVGGNLWHSSGWAGT